MVKNDCTNEYIFISRPYDSPVGELEFCAVVTEGCEECPKGALAAVMMKGQKYYMDCCEKIVKDLGLEGTLREEDINHSKTQDPQSERLSAAQDVFCSVREWLDRYFRGEHVGFDDLKCETYLHGSAFRKRVWEILKKIPYGETTTYGDIAKQLDRVSRDGSNMSAQAVGGAVGHNPIGIIIPCHRVLGASGKLTGYAGGIEKKIRLLEIEQAEF